MKLKPYQRITYDVAKQRALKFLDEEKWPRRGACVGQEIWPDNDMRAQGLGAAASRILKRMHKDGLVYWTYAEVGRFRNWGYRITSVGRKEIAK